MGFSLFFRYPNMIPTQEKIHIQKQVQPHTYNRSIVTVCCEPCHSIHSLVSAEPMALGTAGVLHFPPIRRPMRAGTTSSATGYRVSSTANTRASDMQIASHIWLLQRYR